MNLYEAQEFFKKMYPGKAISYEFDMKCLYQMEVIHSDGKPHKINHVEYQKVKVLVEGMEPMYVPIAPHRGCIEFDEVKKYIAGCVEVYTPPEPKAQNETSISV